MFLLFFLKLEKKKIVFREIIIKNIEIKAAPRNVNLFQMHSARPSTKKRLRHENVQYLWKEMVINLPFFLFFISFSFSFSFKQTMF